MNSKNSETTGWLPAARMPENEIGTPHGEIGYAVPRKPERIDNPQAKTLATWAASHGLREKRNSANELIGLDLAPGVSPGAVLSSLDALAMAAEGSAIDSALEDLWREVTRTQATAADIGERIVGYSEKLAAYPGHIVFEVIEAWPHIDPCPMFPRGGQYFPALAELLWLIKDLMKDRDALRKYLQAEAANEGFDMLPFYFIEGNEEKQIMRIRLALGQTAHDKFARPLAPEYRPWAMSHSEWLRRRDALRAALQARLNQLEQAA